MSPVKKVLVIGGGIAGMCSAILLRKSGREVDLVEIDPEWRVYGAGITISGPTLRAFGKVGVLQEIMDQGWCADGCKIALPNGHVVAELPTPRVAGPDVPGGGAILRPVLARILSKATLASGANVRLGVTFTSIRQDARQAHVAFSDGSESSYDLVIGADGVHSKTRQAVMPEAAAPVYTGQGCWRALVPRAPGIDNAHIILGKTVKAGVNPVSQDQMYLFCLETNEQNAFLDPATWQARLTALLEGFTGVVGEIRDNLGPDSQIIYRPLEKLLVPGPWHRGRVVLIGDAVHATTPHLASGAGISVEDAVVLAEELDRPGTLQEVLEVFSARRHARCKLVVESSVRLGELESAGTPEAKEEHGLLMRDTMRKLLEPI
ncbi:MAG: FAD-dependent oxidoreductase [Pseudomonadota bacterium]